MSRRNNEEEKYLIISSEMDTACKKAENRNYIPARYMFALLSCLGFINVYAMRVNLSVALVAMVNSSALPTANETSECKLENSTDDTNAYNGEFLWDEPTQGVILGSFFYGYIITQLPGGRLAELYSGKWLLGLGILCTAIFTLLTPVAARAGPGYLVAVRIMEGLGEGVTFPTMHAMIARWCPLSERSRFVTVIYAGSLLGTVIGLPISGYLCIHGFDGGWPSVFYVFGGFGVAWFILWTLFAYDSPNQHPWISTEEKLYIQKGTNYYDPSLQAKPPIPWKKLVTSLPLWAITIAHFGQNWGFYTLLTELPTYMKTILGFNMQNNSVLSALPYFTCWLCSLFVSNLCDKLVEKNYMKLTNARKTFNSIGLLVPAGLLFILTFVKCDKMLSYAILVIAMTVNGSIYGGYQCNHIDIAPNFAGTLLGITNTIATIPGWMGPYAVGALTHGAVTSKQWAKVFYITVTIYIVSAIFYIIFGKAEEQSWNRCLIDEPVTSDDESVVHDKNNSKVSS